MFSNLDEVAKKRAIGALIGIIGIIIPVTLFMMFVKNQQADENIDVKNGVAIIDSDMDFGEVVFTLNGEWMCADNVYVESVESLELLLASNVFELRTLPETRLDQVKEQKTYSLDLVFESVVSEFSRAAIAIPFLYEDTKLYLNGMEMEPYEPFSSLMGTDTELHIYLLKDYMVDTTERQKLVITVNEEGDDYGLFRREVMISDVSTFYEQVQVEDGLQNLFVGMMIISILMGWINMLIMPRHNMLTSMTMLDTTLMMYFFFVVCKLPVHTFNALLGGVYGEQIIRGIVLGLFCLAGYWGNRLGRDIFDPDREIGVLEDKILGGVWIFGAVINTIFPQHYGTVAKFFTLLVFMYTFKLLIQRILRCRKKGQYDVVQKIHAFKAMIVGALLTYDLLTLNVYPRNNNILLAGYCLFFFIQLLMRANVHKEAFDVIREDKKVLEVKVEERTKELFEANENLRNLMNIDPLTKAFNRLYFEETLLNEIEMSVTNKEHSFHLCLFDLDNFKHINDTYGHQVGDEQLIDAVKATKNVIGDQGIISRIGGEEFVVMFKDMTDVKVILMVENIRLELEKLSEKEGRTTGSFGVTRYKNDDTRKSAFIRVDQCLYHSKNHDKNCITYEFTERKIYDNTIAKL